ncbi:hypothetical protein L484_010435 [Morus notabilis]|uniref:Uncharacterized protein n=1 Tax=Morus notabilis TaxID=981085 RepID=W9QR68_9ROSA|nr:hypothetical protein L484_010435 [Morus notabilis]
MDSPSPSTTAPPLRSTRLGPQRGKSTSLQQVQPCDFVVSIQRPIFVIILVKSYTPNEQITIVSLSDHMEHGDAIIDSGNEWYENTKRRIQIPLLLRFFFLSLFRLPLEGMERRNDKMVGEMDNVNDIEDYNNQMIFFI